MKTYRQQAIFAASLLFTSFSLALPVPAAAQSQPVTTPSMLVTHSGYKLVIDGKKGGIESFRSAYGSDHDLLIPGQARLPLFKIEFMDEHGNFKLVTSSDAQEVKAARSRSAEGEIITLDFKAIGQLPVDARVTVRCPANEPLIYWSLALHNRTTWWIGHIQFPVVQVPFDSAANQNSSHILWSLADGALAGPVEPSMSIGTWFGRETDTPEVWRTNNYPGEWTTTQLMAYYNDAGGLYLACDDPTGLPKFFDPLLDRDGVTMGIGHYPGTRGPSDYQLPYHVVMGTFHGDWYAAAEIYRAWASRQPFCAKSILQRTDIPEWLTGSPVGIAFPMRGQGDWDPPAAVNPEYTPLTNALPYLDRLAAALKTPLMPIVFNWEQSGPWVQPQAFPPLGGEAAFREFMAKAKSRGWHPVIYGDGLCWVTAQSNTHYDGMPYFRAQQAEAFMARKWDGTLLQDRWRWRKNYVACVGTEKGRQMVLEMTRRMAEMGPDVVQQFDQGPGPRACYATNHGHPPVPGPWMTEAFNGLITADENVARSANAHMAMSCEGAPPETYLQHFQIWDGRITTCPLYSFLYHEYANGHQGFYTHRTSDEALRASVARALVQGYMVNFTLRDHGQIEYDWDQTWTRAVPDQAAIFDWAQRTNQFRAGVARGYLVYGRMLRPWKVRGVDQRDFGWGTEPTVQSSTWQAPNGRVGVVLANYADLPETPQVELEGSGPKHVTLYLDGRKQEKDIEFPNVLSVPMDSRSVGLIEVSSAQ